MTTPNSLGSCLLSYNHADKPLAQDLAKGLKELGYRVWIDEGEIRVGDSLINRISQAIGQVDFVAALVSEHSVASNWCQKEISLAMTEETNGRGLTVLPCKVGSIEMPPTLTDKFYLTIERHDIDEAVATLHRDMQSHLSGPLALPPRRRQVAAQTPSSEESIVASAKRSIANGSRPHDANERLGELLDSIADLDALNEPDYNPPNGNEVAQDRRRAIFHETSDAAALTMYLSAFAEDRDCRRALNAITSLARWPIGHGGSTVLLTQQQAPGVILLAAAGVGAVAEERWDLVDRLLTDFNVQTQTGSQPIATGVDLNEALAGRTGHPQGSRGFHHGPSLLHDYLSAVNAKTKALPRRVFEDAWERWEYLWQIAYFHATRVLLGTPTLAVIGWSDNYKPQCADWAQQLESDQKITLSVLGDGTPRKNHDRAFAETAQSAAWSTLGNSAGALPGSGWRMSETGKFKVPAAERASWANLLP